jgi:hypothetical protein
MTQTTIESSLLIRPVARFVAIGLFLMAFFTTLWALWALYGLPTVVAVVLVAIFVALSVIFVINGVQLIKSASMLPVPSSEESQRRGRAMQLGFGITFASEGVIIAVVCALLGMSGADAYFGPAIALVVGLHFIPFGFIFHRTIDFYIAGWVVIWAVMGIWLIASRPIDPALVGSLVAVATACGTAAYGIYMLRIKRAILGALARS